MNLISKLFGKKKETPLQTNADFWNWFLENDEEFFHIVKQQTNIENGFFNKLTPKLKELKDGYFFLTGMSDDHTAELIITAEGSIKNIVFTEELIDCAPKLERWKFTALKPALDINDVSIEMAGIKFNKDNISFYSNDSTKYPDEIDITIVHENLNDENSAEIINGAYIFLDNYLGELNVVSIIDNLDFVKKSEAEKELVPISKLKDFILWRQKEFIEKYDGTRTISDIDTCAVLEAELNNGKMMIATINTDLLQWDRKASHPWVLSVEINYKGKSKNGMPDDETYERLDELEDELLEELKDTDGYLYIGRQTADDIREIYFVCNDFRKPSKVAFKLIEEHKMTDDISYDIYKDKYWKSFDRFVPPK